MTLLKELLNDDTKKALNKIRMKNPAKKKMTESEGVVHTRLLKDAAVGAAQAVVRDTLNFLNALWNDPDKHFKKDYEGNKHQFIKDLLRQHAVEAEKEFDKMVEKEMDKFIASKFERY